VPGGQGTGPRKASPQYQAILAAWARARFPALAHGLGSPPEGTRYCAQANIQVGSDRQVTGSSVVSSTGLAACDDYVRASMQAYTGATVPADPEGGPPPSSIPIRVCCD